VADHAEGWPVTADNGYSDEPARVRFDHDNPLKVMDLAVAEQMLMDWRKRNPAQFGYWYATAQTGTEPSKTARGAAT
jgi:hypothetical protein